MVIPEVSTMVKTAAQWSRKTSYSIAGLGTEIFHRDLFKETCQRPVKRDLPQRPAMVIPEVLASVKRDRDLA